MYWLMFIYICANALDSFKNLRCLICSCSEITYFEIAFKLLSSCRKKYLCVLIMNFLRGRYREHGISTT